MSKGWVQSDTNLRQQTGCTSGVRGAAARASVSQGNWLVAIERARNKHSIRLVSDSKHTNKHFLSLGCPSCGDLNIPVVLPLVVILRLLLIVLLYKCLSYKSSSTILLLSLIIIIIIIIISSSSSIISINIIIVASPVNECPPLSRSARCAQSPY